MRGENSNIYSAIFATLYPSPALLSPRIGDCIASYLIALIHGLSAVLETSCVEFNRRASAEVVCLILPRGKLLSYPSKFVRQDADYSRRVFSRPLAVQRQLTEPASLNAIRRDVNHTTLAPSLFHPKHVFSFGSGGRIVSIRPSTRLRRYRYLRIPGVRHLIS